MSEAAHPDLTTASIDEINASMVARQAALAARIETLKADRDKITVEIKAVQTEKESVDRFVKAQTPRAPRQTATAAAAPTPPAPAPATDTAPAPAAFRPS